jgi:hypothetical protein
MALKGMATSAHDALILLTNFAFFIRSPSEGVLERAQLSIGRSVDRSGRWLSYHEKFDWGRI